MSIFPRTPACALAFVLASTYGCSAAEEHVKESRDAGSGGMAGADLGTGGTSSNDSASNDQPATLPFAADAYFIPSGYMGDALTEGVVEVAKMCSDPRPAGAVGNCYEFTYTPLADPGAQKWAGVYWQYPQNNWGDEPGKTIAPGASKVTFYAKGGSGGEVIKFVTGGIFDVSKTYHDTMKVDQEVTLTTEMNTYTLDFTGQSAESVLGGFGWAAAAPSVDAGALPSDPDAAQGSGAPLSPVVFWLDGIQWQ
jgi:predicted RecA/RadA family phage recombinase